MSSFNHVVLVGLTSDQVREGRLNGARQPHVSMVSRRRHEQPRASRVAWQQSTTL